MSTSAVHARPESLWKQEVNRRLAEHRCRKPEAQQQPQAPATAQTNASRRAQEAAARVAARYAKTPSYSEVLATEARAALRAAEAASEAALQAKAAAQSVLDSIEAASAAMAQHEPEAMSMADYEPAGLPFVLEAVAVQPRISHKPETIAEPPRTETMDRRANHGQSLSIRWAPELPERHAETAGLHTGQGQEVFQQEWWKPVSAEPVAFDAGEIDMVDPALPIHGNLIEFPRELVATRKVRPRLAESPHADANVQLSIFEVDPGAIATEPDVAQASTSEWAQPSWSGLELDEQPSEMYEELLEEPGPRQISHELQTASFNRRLMALFVDGTLIAGAIVSAAALVLNKATELPSLSAMEHIAMIALVAISALYITLFYAIAPATPGMKYAGIRFCTFEGLIPTRSQRWSRLAAMLLSVLPAGLGLVWSLFDENNLSWHDRLSQTYICNR